MFKINGIMLPNVTVVNSLELKKLAAKLNPRLKAAPSKIRKTGKKIFEILLPDFFKSFNDKPEIIKNNTIVIPIMRAADVTAMLALTDDLCKFNMKVGYIWTKRGKKGKSVKVLASKLPKKILAHEHVIVLDMVVASGISSIKSLELIFRKCKFEGVPSVTFICAGTSAQGLVLMAEKFPEVNILVAVAGENFTLDGNNYIAFKDGKNKDKQAYGDVGNGSTGIK